MIIHTFLIYSFLIFKQRVLIHHHMNFLFLMFLTIQNHLIQIQLIIYMINVIKKLIQLSINPIKQQLQLLKNLSHHHLLRHLHHNQNQNQIPILLHILLIHRDNNNNHIYNDLIHLVSYLVFKNNKLLTGKI